MNIQTTFAFCAVGKDWAGPFFPHPDKIKHQPCAGGIFSPSDNLVHKVDVYFRQGGERMGWPSFSPPLTSNFIFYACSGQGN